MKRILLALAMLGLLLPLAPRVQADAEISLNFFYDNLSPYGDWVEVGDYGYCFQPYLAQKDPAWRPYADGYWAYTDVGWTWVSYEDFGWATYHYGRWTRLADLGWIWVPGYEWGPAWVSWRTGGDYVGWAPLPPAAERIYEGRPITGHVDIEFDIGPLYYNFVDVRYIGEPVLRQRIVEPQRNVIIINKTVNVTNITYNNSVVYNHGPDVNRLNQYSTRPIQRLTLQRQTNVTTEVAAQGGGRNLNRVNGNQLVVVAPQIQKSQQNVAPKQVKTKVTQPKIERGWQGVDRTKVQAAMKKESPKNVPPPSFQPQKERLREAESATPQPAANEQAGASTPNPNPAAAGQQEPRHRAAKKTPGQPATSPAANEPETGASPAAGQPNEQKTREHKRKAKTEGGEQTPGGPSPRSMSEQGQPQAGQAEGAEHPRKARGKKPEQAEPQAEQPGGPPAQQAHRPQRAQPPQPGGGQEKPAAESEGKAKKKKPAASPTPPQG